MPLIVDKMAHAFWASAHVAKVHMHNGEEHVHYELKKAAKENQPNNTEGKHKMASEQSLHIAAYSFGQFHFYLERFNLFYRIYTCNYTMGYSSLVYPPPKG